jgi:hypothetical protein
MFEKISGDEPDEVRIAKGRRRRRQMKGERREVAFRPPITTTELCRDRGEARPYVLPCQLLVDHAA